MGLITTLGRLWSHPFNAGSRTAALLRFVRWQVGARVLGQPVALPFIDDVALLATPGMHAATGNYYYGLQEAGDMGFLLHFLRPGDVFHDVGANIGTFTLIACAAGASRVHAYEPAAQARHWLGRNLGLNGFRGTVEVHALALSNAPGSVRFTEGLDITNHITRASAGGGVAQVTVQAARLDERAAGDEPFFIKIDVEGHETEVLEGCGALLTSPNLLGVLVERNATGAAGEVIADPYPVLVAAGLTPCRYDPLVRALHPLQAVPAKAGNVLFVRDVELARSRLCTAPRFALASRSI